MSLDFFKFVDGLFGLHSFDRFANSETFKINKLNSKFSTPGTSGVDAFAFNWAGENNWQVPPLNIVNKVNNKITELRTILQIRAITKLRNSEQSNKGKVKTHKYINRQNQSTTENSENRNHPALVQAFLKKWWVESDFKAPNLPLSLRLKVSGCHYNSIYNNT